MNVTSLNIYPVINVTAPGPTFGPQVWTRGNLNLELPLTNISYNSPYIVKSITGLEAPDLSDFETERNAHNNFGALTERAISALIVLNPANSEGKTVSELRDHLYRFISSVGKFGVEVQLMDGDNHIASVRGRFTGLETDLFSNTSQAVVTIVCPNPIFAATEPEEFLFSSNYDDGKSTAPRGLMFAVNILEEASEFILTSYSELAVHSFKINQNFEAESAIVVSSIYGNIFAYYTTDGVSYESVVNRIPKDSVFPALYPGINNFEIDDSSNFEVAQALQYPSYWGV